MATTTSDRPLILAYAHWQTGRWGTGWRMPEADNSGVFSAEPVKRIAQQLESAGFDYFFHGYIPNSTPASGVTFPIHAVRFDGFIVGAYVAALTSDIGIVLTTNTSVDDPYAVAAQIGSLEHLSGGRVGLNLVAGQDRFLAQVVADRGGHVPLDGDAKYRKATEWIEIFDGLMQSWEPGWLIDDREAGRFLDASKARRLDHSGEFFHVDGPLNVPPPAQGRIPIFHAGFSANSDRLAARYADVRFSPTGSLEFAIGYRKRVRELAAEEGRDPDQALVVPGAQFIVGGTDAEARRHFRELQSRRNQPYSAAQLCQYFGIEELPLSGSERAAEALAAVAADPSLPNAWVLEDAFAAYGSRDITVLDVHDFVTNNPFFNQSMVVGGTEAVSDWIEQRFVEGAFDGIKFFPPYVGRPLADFIELVLPELRRRRLIPAKPRHGTLRERLGLASEPTLTTTA